MGGFLVVSVSYAYFFLAHLASLSLQDLMFDQVYEFSRSRFLKSLVDISVIINTYPCNSNNSNRASLSRVSIVPMKF